jgi:hypothetical protein
MHQSEFFLKGVPNLIAEPRWRLDDNIDNELPTSVRKIQLLFLELLHRLLNPPASVFPDIGASVQDPVNGRHTQTCLQCDFFNQEAMSQFDPLYLMYF